MPSKKTYYEILGVPRSATLEVIKRRYRQLARKHHPDVAEDKSAAQAAFIEIKEAYEALTDPARRVAYDALLNRNAFNSAAGISENYAGTEQRAERRSTTESAQARREAARRYIADARIAFVHKRYASAVKACREAQRLDPKNAEACIILGDVYQAQGRIEEAVTAYAAAAHLSPSDKSVRDRLGNLSQARRRDREAEDRRQKLLKSGYGLIAGAVIIFLFGLLAISKNPPAPWFAESIKVIDKWSTLLVIVLLVDGALIGMLMSINGNINRMDNELIYSAGESGGLGSGTSPVILFVLSASLFNFYLAVGLYLVIGLAEENFSKSLLKVFGAVFIFVLLVSIIYWPGREQVITFGGNLVLPAMVFGWVIGDVLKPSW